MDGEKPIEQIIEQIIEKPKKKSKEQQKIYSETFYKKHKNRKVICDICFGSYDKFNKYHHINRNKHKLALANLNKENINKVD